MTGSEIYAGTFAFLPEDEETGWNWSFLDEKHPALAPLTKPPSLYLGVSVDRYMKLTWPEDRAVRVLARLDNGDPALVSHQVGSGTVYTLTTGAHAQWTSLPLRPIFVPLINRLILHSAERDRGPLEVMPGNRVPFRFANEPEPVTVEIAMPGDAGSVRLKSQPKDEFQEVTFEQTDRAGVYHVKMIKAQHPRNYAFAVNFDPAEADPETLTPDELRQRLGEDVLIATDEASLADTIKRLHEGTPLMDWFLIAVLVGGVLEVLVANRMGQQEPLPLEGRKRSTIHDILRRAQTVHQLEGYGRSA
ncbi:MAG: hypothetical protein GXP27_10830 [Planctomycetes bacterium]|nr:hypothetical protein [Planctomycetota bacterium]